jgi:integral membrane protein
MNFSSNIGKLRFFAVAEGISYLAFGLTMPLKYVYGIMGPNKIIGYAHGFLFLAYILMVFLVNRQSKWNLKTNAWSYLASLIPFGTFVADAKIFKPTEHRLNKE